jgi:SAM-dependent methyltransferase
VVVSAPDVVWHDLECGSYRADLPLWRELAGSQAGEILDVGAGAGRVTLDLARAGHRVTALDLDPGLLAALRERAAGLEVQTVCADARAFELDRRDFDLCLVPMQTLQLLGGPVDRLGFLQSAHAHLRAGGLLACAIVTALDPFDCAAGDTGPSPETAWVDETLYTSRATRVSVLDRAIAIERERRIAGPLLDPESERNVIELDRVTPFELEREALAAGLRPLPARQIRPTDEHVGSTVVMFGA